MSAPNVISTATVTFGSTVYKLKSIPAGRPRTCEAIDVTCCDDTRKKFAPGALVVNGEISAKIAGDDMPAVNSKQGLSISLGSETVDCGDCVVKSVTPDNVEASGTTREMTATVVFQPCGEDPSAS